MTFRKSSAVQVRLRRSLWVSPPMLLTWIWFFVFLLRSTSLLQFEPLSPACNLFLFSCYAGFTVFYLAFSIPLLNVPPRQLATDRQTDVQKLVFLALLFSFIGLIGASIRGIDIYFTRGLDFSQGIGAARLENIANVSDSGAGQSPLSGIARIMAAFSPVAAMVTVLRWEQVPLAKVRLIMCIFSAVLCQSILEGGRNTIAVNLIFVSACMIVRYYKGNSGIPGGKRLRQAILLTLAAVPFFFAYVFVDRFEALGHGSGYAFVALENLFNVQFSPTLTQWESDWAVGLSAAFTGVALYVTHALNELEWVLQWTDQHSLGWGSYNFDLIMVSLSRLGFQNLSFDPNSLTRPGVYMTALGEFAIDFGPAGAVCLCALLGMLFGRAWNSIRRRSSLATELWLALGLAALMVSPLYSIIPGFLGTLIAAALFVYLLHRKPRRQMSPGRAIA